MVLDKLGSSLKDTLSKIAKSIFVDDKLINELVKDIQRALLQSDVNVKLVFELTNKIKDRITKEQTPAALTKKEHLINIVYEELTNFLGKDVSEIKVVKSGRDGKEPFKIMLVGLFGSGKCVHKDSNILLWDGQTINVEKLYNIYKERGEFELEDGFIVQLEDDIYVPSLNPYSLKVEKKVVSYLWKLKSKNMLQINLDNGNNFNIKTTYEHPFFALIDGKMVKKRADKLERGDFVAVPANFVSEPKSWEFQNLIKNMDLDVFVCHDEINAIKKSLLAQYGTLQNTVARLPYKRNYSKFTYSFKRGQVPISIYNNIFIDKFKVKHFKAMDIIDFPAALTKELSELIGYIIGDGYLSRRGIHISTADIEIIDRIKELSHTLFSKQISETPDKRSKAVHLRINSSTAALIIHELFGIPIGKKGRYLEVPRLIQESSIELTSCFLQAYFDCDGHFVKKSRCIDVMSESKILLRQIQHMLLRFNILGTQSKKEISGKEYYRLCIQARHAEFYANRIKSKIKRKQDALESYKLITLRQGDGKKDMIPVGSTLKEIREKLGYSINQIQKEVFSYGRYEKKGFISKSSLRKVLKVYERKHLGNFKRLVNLLEDKEVGKLSEHLGMSQPLVNSLVGEFKRKGLLAEITNSPKKLVFTEKGKSYSDKFNQQPLDEMQQLVKLAYADVSWIKVNSIAEVENDANFVYDLTVEGNHNFIADGVIVHNTTTTGKIAKYFTKRGYKVALVGLDVHRAAAIDQIMQVGKAINVPVYSDKEIALAANAAQKTGKTVDVNNALNTAALRIYEKFEKLHEYEKYDILIIDTAGRDALSEELVEELKLLNGKIKPNENLLVLSADIGQAAQKQAQSFHDACGVTGVTITKLDGTAKGGGALSACSVTNANVKFIGVGEKVDDLEYFSPKRFVGRLLGMGDIESLLEKAKDAMDEISEEKAKDMGEKFMSGKFNLVDLYQQMEAMSKMGPLGKVMELIPGMGQLKLPKDMISVQEGKLKKWKYIMNSCTKKELEDPELISGTRIERIARGSGCSINEIRELLKQYKQSKKMVKMMGGGSPRDMERMMKKLQGGGMPQMKFR